VKPIPVAFHIGPLEVHTYGIGLAVTFWFAYRYFARRLRAHGYDDRWLGATFVWVIVAAIVGARVVHVVAHLSYYTAQPLQILEIWHGGLSSFGGLALGVPTGFLLARRRCPDLRSSVAADLVAPVLVAAWALGRLLGPQLMIAGGGKPTTAWYGMYYAGEVGKRVPVPLFQAIECTIVFLVALAVERRVARRGGRPVGLVATVATSLWGLTRFFDEYLWLPHGAGGDAVEVVSLCFVGVGGLVAAYLVGRERRRISLLAHPPEGTDPGAPSGAARVKSASETA
jgi:phosphatidylglycerol:prolipoprotein diacylglycerol transferase